jgi:hypothetical protein
MSLDLLDLRKKSIAIHEWISYTLCLSELTGKEDRKNRMSRTGKGELDASIARTLGALYERQERGNTLIRVLEDYRRFKMMPKPCRRNSRHSSQDSSWMSQQELVRLRMRRAAVDQVIRSIEAYSATQASAQAHH